ncbi:hypothetical protein L9F63_023856, partial [Diploptera punctata]
EWKSFGAPFGTSATPNLHQRVSRVVTCCEVFDAPKSTAHCRTAYRLYTAFECFIT